MTDEVLPHAVWSGEFVVWGVVLHCHVLSNGQRVIDGNDIERLFEGPPVTLFQKDDPGVEAFVRWQRGQ